MPTATPTRPKSQTRKTSTTAAAGASATKTTTPYFEYSHVPREARIVPNKSPIGFSVQVREQANEYGPLGQWHNVDAMPLWALRQLLDQVGYLRGGGQTAVVRNGATPIAGQQFDNGMTAEGVAASDKLSVGSSI